MMRKSFHLEISNKYIVCIWYHLVSKIGEKVTVFNFINLCPLIKICISLFYVNIPVLASQTFIYLMFYVMSSTLSITL